MSREEEERRRPAGWTGAVSAPAPERRRDAAELAGEDAGAPTRLYYAVLITLAVEVVLFYVFTRMLA